MKKAILIFLLLGNITPAHADEGGWVKVNAQGQVISGTSVCTPDVCGNVNSEYSKLTLAAGERYVQINKADTTGNVVGPNVIGHEKMTGQFDAVANTVKFTKEETTRIGANFSFTTLTATTYAVGQGQVENTRVVTSVEATPDWIVLLQEFFVDLFANFVWSWTL